MDTGPKSGLPGRKGSSRVPRRRDLCNAKQWSLTTLRDKLIKIGAKVVHRARYVTFQLAEVELAKGRSVCEVCKQLGVTDQTYYRWRKEYGGIRTDQARLKELERENGRLKKAVAGKITKAYEKAYSDTYDIGFNKRRVGETVKKLLVQGKATEQLLKSCEAQTQLGPKRQNDELLRRATS